MTESTLAEVLPRNLSFPEIFDRAAKEVAKIHNGAFVPEEVAACFGDKKDDALEIFLSPGAHFYPDVPAIFENFKRNPELDVMIVTQGQMLAETKKGRSEEPHIGFQPIKIEASGVLDMFDPLWEKRLKEVGLETIIGGFEKTSEEFFRPIVEAIRMGGYKHVVALDDKEEILAEFGKRLEDTGVNVRLIHVKRGQKKREVKPDSTSEFTTVDDLSQVEIPQGRTLVLCDFDGTLSDTNELKQSYKERLNDLEHQLPISELLPV